MSDSDAPEEDIAEEVGEEIGQTEAEADVDVVQAEDAVPEDEDEEVQDAPEQPAETDEPQTTEANKQSNELLLVEDGAGEAEMDLSDADTPATTTEPVEPSVVLPEAPHVNYEYVSLATGSTDSLPQQMSLDSAAQKRSLPSISASSSRNDRMAKLDARIAQDAWDTDAWIALLGEAMRRNEAPVIQDTFERFVKQFPTSARHWISYAEYEISRSDVQRIESIFARCLKLIPDVDLWNCYLSYVRRRYSSPSDPSHRGTVSKAFEFVLQNVGLDKDSGGLWADYIAFLKTGEVKGTYEEQQKMDILRKTYHRALSVPISNIEQLWRDYDAYEHSLSRMTAKKFISDRSAGYMLARTGQRELKILMEPLEGAMKGWLAKPPGWSEKECQLLMTWKRYIEWERSNPLKLEDKNQLTARVLHAYKRALIMLRMFPALWHEASTYLTEVGKNDEALAILKSGTEALPTSSLLHLSLADLYESRGQVPAAKALYEGLVENLEKQITGINSRAEGEKARAVGAVQAAIKAGALDGEEREDKWLKEKAAVEKLEAARAKEVGEVREALALTWVFYMRFARRTENIKAARAVFSRARKSPNCLPHVFVASALMEHYISKDPQVAGRIFELGLKSVPEGNGELLVPYISEYLDWLISQNDDNNTRALFERSLLAVPPAQARQIWSKFTAYEVQFGDLASLLRVEKRRAEAFPEDAYHMAGLVDLADRYTYLDLTVVRDRELGLQALQGLDKAIALKPKPRATSASTSDARQSADTGEGKAKGPLDPFHPERFPRPDFGRYTVHKTDKAAPQRPNPPGMIISVPLPPKPTTPSLAVPSSGKQGAVPTGPMIPELIATLISALPPAHAYTGPHLPAQDLLNYISSLRLIPTQPLNYVPYPTSYGGGSPGYGSPSDYRPGGSGKRRNEDDRGGAPKRFRD